MVDKVTISGREYQSLLEAKDTLDRLKAYGVDNWEGYGQALRDEDGYFDDNWPKSNTD